MEIKDIIAQHEEQLIEAMKSSNVAVLNELLSDKVFFTNHNGHLIAKDDDLETHRSGKLEIYSIEPSAQLIEVLDDNNAIVSVVKDLSSAYDGHVAVGIMRFTRVWHYDGIRWKVVAAHSSQIV